MLSRSQILVVTMFAILLGGIASLWIYQTRTFQALENSQNKILQENSVDTSNSPYVSPIPTKQATISALPTKSTSSPISPEKTLTNLEASISALLIRVEELEKNSSNKTTPTNSTSTPLSAITFTKQVIYMGSTSTNKRDWTDSGLEVILNSADYPSDVHLVFEAGLSIIGGEAWARVINKTTGAIISLSEVSHNNSTTTWKTSPTFKLHSGSNTYVVEVRSTSGEVVNLSGARLVVDR